MGKNSSRRGLGVSAPCRGLALSLAGLVLLSCLASCHFNYGDEGSGEDSSPDAVFSNFTYTIMIRDARILEIKAERAESYSTVKKTELSGITFTQFDEKTGEPVATGRADSALVFTDTENAEFSGSVVLNWKAENTVLRAEYLNWDSDKKELSSRLDQTVEIEKSDGTRIRGAGFTASTRKRDFLFRDSVEGAFSLKDK